MDLSISYLGLELPHPLIGGASPLADTLDSARRLEDAGLAAITLRSLFEEQFRAETMAAHFATEGHADSSAEAADYFARHHADGIGPEAYCEHVRRLKEALGIPVIASLNGVTLGGWTQCARLIEQAGADALELNFYHVAADPVDPSEAIERRLVEIVRALRAVVRIPLAVKLSPYFTSLSNVAHRVAAAGADSLVLFNRFIQPDVDLDELDVVSRLKLSTSDELLLRLRWLAVLYGRVHAHLAVTGGVHTHTDALKAVMCGARAVQLVSTLLIHGPRRVRLICEQMSEWLEAREYDSLRQALGSLSLERTPSPQGYERANYVHILQTWEPHATVV